MGRTQLNIRMDDERKAEWRDYADEARWADNLTDFVKDAVREKIERMDADGAEGAEFDIPDVDVSGDSEVADTGEVLERLQDLRNDMQDLAAEVGGAVDAVHAQQGVDPEVSPDVYQALPTGEVDATTAEDLAHATGYRHATVRFALENMRRNGGLGVRKLVEVENPESGETAWVEGDAEHVEGYETSADPRWYKAEGA
jgi:hypothetical protein